MPDNDAVNIKYIYIRKQKLSRMYLRFEAETRENYDYDT